MPRYAVLNTVKLHRQEHASDGSAVPYLAETQKKGRKGSTIRVRSRNHQQQPHPLLATLTTVQGPPHNRNISLMACAEGYVVF